MMDLEAAKDRAQMVGSKAGLRVRRPLRSARMGLRTDCLGTTHDLSVIVSEQLIRHWPGQDMQTKLKERIVARLQENTCRPAQSTGCKAFVTGWRPRSTSI